MLNKQRAVDRAWCEIVALLQQQGKSLDSPEFVGLPKPTSWQQEEDFDPERERVCFERLAATLYRQQADVIEQVKSYLQDPAKAVSNCIFVGGSGGCGKTYLYNAIYHLVRSHPKGGSVVNMASTGIAATLLPQGRTVHNAFKLPVPLYSHSKSMVTASQCSRLIKEAKAFLWDESPMSSRYALEIVDQVLREVHSSDKPFEGVLMILGGDFRVSTFIKYG